MTPRRSLLFVAISFLVAVAIGPVSCTACPADQQINTDPGLAYSTSSIDTTGFNCDIMSPPTPPRWPLGENTVVCTEGVAGANGTSCTFTVTVRDNEPPTTSCPPSKREGTDSGQITGVVKWNKVTFFNDNVEVTTSACIPMSGTAFSLGTKAVTCTASDAAGNDAVRCTFRVTIVDEEAPVFTSCPSGTITKIFGSAELSVALTAPSAQVTWDEPSAVDNDGITPVLESLHRPGDEFPAGVTVVTYNATDQAGNTNTADCSFRIAVLFEPKPEVSVSYTTIGLTPCFAVAWTRSYNPTVSEYTISAWKTSQDESVALRVVVQSVDNTYNKHSFCAKFSPGELYTIKVEAGGGESRQPIGTTQQWTRPDNPAEVKLVAGTRSYTSAEVTWSGVTLQNVEQYHIEIPGIHSSYVTKTTNKILLDNVFPATRLVFVKAVVGSGDMRIRSSGPLTPVMFRGVLDDSKLLAVSTESTVVVYWNLIPTSTASNDPYMLYIEPEDAEENYLSEFSSSQASFTGLKPNTEYQIRLISNAGLSLSTSVKTKPGPPRNLRPTEVLADSITLEWDPPTEGSVDSYEVYISPGDSDEPMQVSGTGHAFSSLTNKTEYFFKIVAIYDGMESLPKTLMVTAGVTKPAPSMPIDIIAIALDAVLGVVALFLIICVIITCCKFRKLKADMNTRARYETALPTAAVQSGMPRVPIKVVVNERPYENSVVADKLADRIVGGQRKPKNMPLQPMNQSNEGEYAYVSTEG